MVAQKTFYKLWNTYLPRVIPMKPMTDLCWTCQQNSTVLMRAANQQDSAKSAVLLAAQQHLTAATTERSVYTSDIARAKECLADHGIVSLSDPSSEHWPCSIDIMTHYSFDFAQQVHYPASPLQAGPIYFKTPRKCGIFGVIAEAVPRMVIYLLDEGLSVGKGSNCVISMVHHFFTHYGLQETICHLHADNCAGQNKNNAMIQYLLWRVMTGRHKSVKISFMLAGHTKFAPDWAFGIFKRKFRQIDVNCLADIATAVCDSSPSGVNIPQLCGDESGSITVPMYNWNDYLADYFVKLPAIKKYQHFQALPNGTVVCKMAAESPAETFKLVKSRIVENMPALIQPSGLTRERKAYLYEEIRDFVADPWKDIVCPLPPDPAPVVTAVTPDDDNAAVESDGVSIDIDERVVATRGRGRPRKRARGRGRGARVGEPEPNMIELASPTTKRGRGRGNTSACGRGGMTRKTQFNDELNIDEPTSTKCSRGGGRGNSSTRGRGKGSRKT